MNTGISMSTAIGSYNAAGAARTNVPICSNAANNVSASGDVSAPVDTSNPVATSSVFGSANFNPNAMTPESLMTYLSSRLSGIDKQMNDVFSREQKGEHVRSELHQIQEMLTHLKSGEKSDDTGTIPDFDKFRAELNGHIKNVADIDADLGKKLYDNIYGEGQLMFAPGETTTSVASSTAGVEEGYRGGSSGDPTASQASSAPAAGSPPPGDGTFTTAELQGTKDFLNIVSKDLDSSSQMDMINLQQLMSTRQTAIQMATNLVAACGESAKAIASNIR